MTALKNLDGCITHEHLLERIDALAPAHRLVGPVARGGPDAGEPRRYLYEPVERAAQIALDFSYCTYGPKAAVLPPRETLFRFEPADHGFHARSVAPDPPTALVGVHPCDVRALAALDAAFSREPADEAYVARRRSLFVVGVDCPVPCMPGVFCGDLGTHEVSDGCDVMLYRCFGDGAARYGVRVASIAGRDWLQHAVTLPAPADQAAYVRYVERKREAFPPRLRIRAEEIPKLLASSYDASLWEREAARCYSCGSCNLVCPTCYCFDVREATTLKPGSGSRERVWDGCMLRDFAVVAGGHDFRGDVAARLRHRILRKGAWIAQRLGQPGCVGCARCERACTARIGISDILNRLAEEVADVSG